MQFYGTFVMYPYKQSARWQDVLAAYHNALFNKRKMCKFILPYFSIDSASVIYKKRSKFVKNEHARYTLGMKKGKNLERLITAPSQARF